MSNAYTGAVEVHCPDNMVRIADVHYSPMYGRDRASVRFQGKRVTGDTQVVNGELRFVPDPLLQNGGAFRAYAG